MRFLSSVYPADAPQEVVELLSPQQTHWSSSPRHRWWHCLAVLISTAIYHLTTTIAIKVAKNQHNLTASTSKKLRLNRGTCNSNILIHLPSHFSVNQEGQLASESHKLPLTEISCHYSHLTLLHFQPHAFIQHLLLHLLLVYCLHQSWCLPF